MKQLEREELALEMFSEGASNGQVAAAWTTSGYYPLPAAAGSPPVAETPSLESARRVVARLKSDLRRSGQLPPDIAPARKAGAPRKASRIAPRKPWTGSSRRGMDRQVLGASALDRANAWADGAIRSDLRQDVHLPQRHQRLELRLELIVFSVSMAMNSS